ncbi:Peptidase inhibitor I78 family protein [Pseudomonas sp. ok272]|uniref:hypothetical protein n=1 Tax=unclassified Pseudomonas TaxID=196821 RepID=UPI0008D76EE2|nr:MULTISPECIES: hypothetical protein [unclassified Pseudomonas]SEN31567.1 Peptidase inhibitor I78 family protein [Pseudomonas sp. ok272]SFN19134.1 Peptidase inhibitor I78 family protein [Pseudomonas sp. ok602]
MSNSTEIANQVAAVIGQPYSDALAALLAENTGRPVRPAGKGYYGTTDLRPERINLNVNDEGLITSYSFG